MDSLSKIQQNLDFKSVTTEPVSFAAFKNAGIHADVLRLDKIHSIISGNKWFKLKYHLLEAIRRKSPTVLTFGGAWSNHIVASAWACKVAGIPSIGIIRGEQPLTYSDTLNAASDLDMQLVFVSREAYQAYTSQPGAMSDKFIDAQAIPRNACIIPAGGAGGPGIKGASEILELTDAPGYTHIACSIGTSTMFAGLVQAAAIEQTIIGIPALKGFHQNAEQINAMIGRRSKHPNWHIADNYHFGGYARKTPELIHFMNELYCQTGIETDFVYTGKLFFACSNLATQHFFPPGSRLLIIHSGGLQGNTSLSKNILQF
ncbi:MAG: pyridoxal-phosphate dependent enzyme [Chitinophagaceae bacterium]